MKGPTENNTQPESPIEGKNLIRIGESVTEHRAGSGRAHRGLDLFAPIGSPVVSAVSGKVLRVVDGSTSTRTSGQRAGWFVDILGSDGLIYRYLHLAEKPTVRANQAIRAGAKLGTVGTSGIQRSGPHVHFEIRRGDYSEQRRNYGEPVDPLTVLPLRNLTNGGIRMANANSQTGGAGTSAAYKPAAIDLNSPDARAALAFLVSKGWTQDDVEQLLNKHAEVSKENQVEEHLLSLGWSKSDIARLLVGPEKSHLTAETLFSQHAANSAADQETLLKALAQAGAQSIKPDPSLLSGLNPTHLNPESPSDLEQLIAQFAELPDVQKQRFLLLLDSQKPNKKTSASNSDVASTRPKKAAGTADADSAKSSGPRSDVLPIVKSSLDLLSTALKGLLGSAKDGSKKGANGSGTANPIEDSIVDESDDEEPSSQTEDDDTEAGGSDGTDDFSGTDEDLDLPSEPEDLIDAGNEREPD